MKANPKHPETCTEPAHSPALGDWEERIVDEMFAVWGDPNREGFRRSDFGAAVGRALYGSRTALAAERERADQAEQRVEDYERFRAYEFEVQRQYTAECIARAEAAEARLRVLEEAARSVLPFFRSIQPVLALSRRADLADALERALSAGEAPGSA